MNADGNPDTNNMNHSGTLMYQLMPWNNYNVTLKCYTRLTD
jgi:hypothetical protein